MNTATRRAPVLLFALGTAVLAQEPAPTPAADPGEAGAFVELFNGVDLEGWWGLGTVDPATIAALAPEQRRRRVEQSLPDIRAHWRVEDGELINDGAGLYLTTRREFTDFELHLEYRTVAGADSGVYLRGCPQVQIWDTTEAGGKWQLGADKGSGGLWNNGDMPGRDPLRHADRPFGEWNRLRIRMVGAYVTVHLNDVLVVRDAVLQNYFDRDAPIPRAGPIQLQTHGGAIRWRRLRLREIPAPEANVYLAALGGDGLADALNGVDLQGWSGPTEHYTVEDGGVLRCVAGKGGTIYTDAEYGDFTVQLEFALPPGGNNGLAIRYPGAGDTAYVGMCELQVLDDTHPKFKDLDPRQYHGSAYGMVAAHRGYQRPVGTWNFQQVWVRGSRIRVELNGTAILDADLAAVTELMADRPHPGRARTRGHFGFAGHSDPVRFRRVRIAALDR